MDSGKPVAVVSPENRILEQQQQQHDHQQHPLKPPPLNPVGSAFGVKSGGIPPPPTAMAPSGPPVGVGILGQSPGRGGGAFPPISGGSPHAGGLLQHHNQTPPRSGGGAVVAAPPAWPTCIRIESAPEDVSNADVVDFFDGLSITSNGVHIHQLPGGGKIFVMKCVLENFTG